MSFRHRLPLLLLLLLLLSSAANLTATLSQCSTLLQSFTLKPATWQPTTNCCKWDGVKCAGPGLVTALDLSNRSINGNITASLFNLTSLRVLNLAYNKFDKIPISNGFGNLYNLTYLNLSDAGFVGQIPIGIAKLTKLEILDLSTFYLNEQLANPLVLKNPDLGTLVRNLSSLKELYLDSINISAGGWEWSALLAKLTPKLRALSLVGCSITGPIDSSLSVLSDLEIIRLDENELNCSLPKFFGGFSSLRELRLSFCGLHGVFPEGVFRLRNLTVIDLSSNEMLSGSLPEFHEGSKLQSLKLSQTKFSGYLPDSVGRLKYLRTLDLSYCNFSGFIPASVSNLTELVYLDLSNNGFSGAIPSVLPPRISNLQLWNNSLNGSIPSSFGNLQLLIQLDLRENSLTGQIPASLFSLPLLKSLNLNSNKLSGEIQKFSNGLSSQLGTLDLGNNMLHGEIPRSAFQLLKLKILNLSSNNFSGIVEIGWLRTLLNLTSLDLSYNSLSIQDTGGSDLIPFPNITSLALVSCNLTKVPRFLRYVEQLSSLDLSNNKISGAIPNWMWTVGKNSLTYLNLSYNLFTSVENLPRNFSISPLAVAILDLHSNLLEGPIPLPPINTVLLDYSNNSFSSVIPSHLASYLNYTVFLSLSNNNLSGEIPASICTAAFLQVLDFSVNNLSGQIPPCFLDGSINLVVLNLGSNQLQGSIPRNLSNQCALKTLNLNNNILEGSLPRSLTNCNHLQVLDVGNNHLKGIFPFWLGKSRSLQVLVLGSNELYGPVELPTGLDFPLLQIFDISSNKFNGSIPIDFYSKLDAMKVNSVSNRSSVDFKYLPLSRHCYQDTVTITFKGMQLELVKTLTLFSSLDFSNNGFEGSIPEVIGELWSLIMLNFSHNALTGGIPASMRNLEQLEALDLSSNYLSGNIPQDLSSLTFLSYLNLSNNKLTGRIPQGNQLATFSNASYEGNSGLCGFPLTEQCPNAEPPSNSVLPSFETYSLVNWHYVLIGLGYGTGLAILIGTLMVSEKWRKWYLNKVDTMLLAVVPQSFRHICDYCGDSRVGAEEVMDSDSMESEGWHGRKFCVYCTKLDFYEGRLVIYHVDCDCPLEGET